MARRHTIAAGVIAAAVTIAVPWTQRWEGVWLTVKPDRLAYNLPTGCYGETEGIKLGQKFTLDQCAAMLRKKLPRYANEIARCIHVPVSPKLLAAFIVTSYNIGSAGFCHSTMARRLNAGDYRGACDALLHWTRAGGKVRQGLINRREFEREKCLEGI